MSNNNTITIDIKEYERLKECEKVCEKIHFISGIRAEDINWKSFELIEDKCTAYNNYFTFDCIALKDEHIDNTKMRDSVHYFPNYTCGECSVNLAANYFNDSINNKYKTVNDLIKDGCKNCELYKKGIKQIASMIDYKLDDNRIVKGNLLTYKNIFIEDIMDGYNSFYRVKNRVKKHSSILDACVEIDEEILTK